MIGSNVKVTNVPDILNNQQQIIIYMTKKIMHINIIGGASGKV